jgi:hypothetical protein
MYFLLRTTPPGDNATETDYIGASNVALRAN